LTPFKHYFLADGKKNIIKLSAIYDVSAKSAALEVRWTVLQSKARRPCSKAARQAKKQPEKSDLRKTHCKGFACPDLKQNLHLLL
jgi:hypothetical protein